MRQFETRTPKLCLASGLRVEQPHDAFGKLSIHRAVKDARAAIMQVPLRVSCGIGRVTEAAAVEADSTSAPSIRRRPA